MFTKSNVSEIHDEIKAALDAIAKKHNLSIAKTHITYSNTNFKFTGEFGDKSEIGDVNPLYFKDTQRHGWVIGLSTSQIGTKIKLHDTEYEIQGMKGRNYVIGKDVSNGKLYKLDPFKVKEVLK